MMTRNELKEMYPEVEWKPGARSIREYWGYWMDVPYLRAFENEYNKWEVHCDALGTRITCPTLKAALVAILPLWKQLTSNRLSLTKAANA